MSHLDALPDRDDPCGPECEFLTVTPSEPGSAAPIACTLSGDDLQQRAEQWRSVLRGATGTAVPDGLRLTVPSDRAAAITDLAVAEQRCCAFFDFRLHLDGAYLHLEVRAPADAAAFLFDLFA